MTNLLVHKNSQSLVIYMFICIQDEWSITHDMFIYFYCVHGILATQFVHCCEVLSQGRLMLCRFILGRGDLKLL